MAKKYYLAYGSNLNLEQMAVRCPHAVPIGTGYIEDYKLAFRRTYLTIEPKAGARVFVGVWEIREDDEMRLDIYEGFPNFYYKTILPIKYTSGRYVKSGMVYVMNDGYPIECPSKGYLRTVATGCRDFGIDFSPVARAYNEAVRATDTTTSTTKLLT